MYEAWAQQPIPRYFVAIDDSNQGRLRTVGPFATENLANVYMEKLDAILDRDPFVRKRVIVESVTLEDPDVVLNEFEETCGRD